MVKLKNYLGAIMVDKTTELDYEGLSKLKYANDLKDLYTTETDEAVQSKQEDKEGS